MIAAAPPMRVSAAALRAHVAAIFAAAGSSDEEAAIMADHLTEANLVGHESHGVIRVAKYLDWLGKGHVVANRHATLTAERDTILSADGGFGYGQVIAREAVTAAIPVARRHGVAVLTIRNTGHLGRVGAWAEQAAAAGLASLHFVNTSGFGMLVAPFGGSDRRLSANPIAAGAPRAGGAPIILDISTAAIAEGKIQVALNKGEDLPAGCTLDGAGRPTRDARAFYGPPPGALLAFGGHKGYGLSVFCEIFAGALTGGCTTNPANETAGRLANNMFSLLVDPDAFGGAEAVGAEVARLADWLKASPPQTAGSEVLLPGEVERRTRAERLREGIALDPVTFDQLAGAAASVGVAPLAPAFEKA